MEEAARLRGVSLDIIRLDVTDPASMEEAFQAILEKSGELFEKIYFGELLRRITPDTAN